MPFAPYGPLHVAVLASVLVALVGLVALGRSLGRRHAHRHAVAVALALGNASMYAWMTVLELRDGRWSLVEGLPLHLCDLSALVIAHALVTRNRRSFELGYYLGVAGGLAGLVVPQVTRVDAYFAPFFVWHALLLLGPVYLVAAYGLRPRVRGIIETLLLVALLAIPIGAIDALLSANYMFLRGKPHGAESFPGEWPWYLPLMLLAGGLVFLASYLPFALLPAPAPDDPRHAPDA